MEQIRIGADDAGQRLDQFLRKYLTGAKLPTVYKLIRTRQVRVNGKKSRPERRLEEGDVVLLHPKERRLGELRGKSPAARPAVDARGLDVLYEDEHVMAVAKPPFLLVHEGEKGGEPTLIDMVLARLGPSDSKTFRPALAHRLDRLTSGVVLVGKSALGLRGLTGALKRGEVEKVYLALVLGEVEGDEGEIDAPLRRDDLYAANRPKVVVDRGAGKSAVTLYRVLCRHDGYTLLEVRPRTGRTHQIRAHLRHLGHPIVGDATYGDPDRNRVLKGRHGLWRQWLHALSVTLDHPADGSSLSVSAPLPEDLLRALDGVGIPRSHLPSHAL